MGEQGKAKAEFKAAEREFEEARLKLLRLEQVTSAARTSPVISAAEIQLQDSINLVKERTVLKDNLFKKNTAADASIKTLIAKAAEVERAIKEVKRLEAELRKARATRGDEMSALRREMEDYHARIKILIKAKEKYDKIRMAAEEEAQNTLGEIRGMDGSEARLKGEIEKVRAQVDIWHKQRVQAASLHSKAHGLLNRPAEDMKPASDSPKAAAA